MEQIREEIYNIIEDYDKDGDIQECVEEIENFLSHRNDIDEYSVWYDSDVFDSPGLDIGYIAVSWTDMKHEIYMCGSAFYNE